MVKKKKDNTLLIVGTVAALGAGGYFLLKGKLQKADIIVQYQTDADAVAAQTITTL